MNEKQQTTMNDNVRGAGEGLRQGQYHVLPLAAPTKYPRVLMPKAPQPWVKEPAAGRSNVRGFLEQAFASRLQHADLGVEVMTDRHLRVPLCQLPYEPDIILHDAATALYIDLEIDEPYDGYSRLPRHSAGADSTRDRFFVESGWVVVHLTEQQIHRHPQECIEYLRKLLALLRKGNSTLPEFAYEEEPWTETQAYRWEREHYRERYLGIDTFGEEAPLQLVMDDPNAPDPIEGLLQRTRLRPGAEGAEGMVFDEESHTYYPVGNATGAADYESVTTAIGRFFPFDTEQYVEQKARRENRSEAEVMAEFEELRADASNRGTDMHANIEHFLKKDLEVHDDSKEFAMFMDFYHDNIEGKVAFADAEKQIFLDEYRIAGTADALFRKKDGSYIMVDWKRSKHLIIDGHPRKFGHGRGLSIVSHLDASSYYKYELQQSFYRYILEERYGMRLSAMVLVVLHPDYDRYYLVPLQNYRKKEVQEILCEITKGKL